MPPLWTKLTPSERNSCHVRDDEQCYYARQRKHGGYDQSNCNQLISNFKIPTSAKDTARWAHKEFAISKFAEELGRLIAKDARVCVTFIPTSKHHEDSEYDRRNEMTLATLRSTRKDIKIANPIKNIIGTDAAHTSNDKKLRDPTSIMKNYKWHGFHDDDFKVLVICDDVFTSGAHYRACKDFIQKNYDRDITIVGAFWGLQVT